MHTLTNRACMYVTNHARMATYIGIRSDPI